MIKEKYILILWLVVSGLMCCALLLPHREISAFGFLNTILQVLLGLLSISVARQSKGLQVRFLYYNFGIFFLLGLALMATGFVGRSIFTTNRFSVFYSYLYINEFGLNLTALFIFVYVFIDLLKSSWSSIVKYGLSIAATLLILLPLYSPYLWHPFELYNASDYKAFKDLKEIVHREAAESHAEPSDRELVSGMILRMREEQHGEGAADSARAAIIVNKLHPYLDTENEGLIFWRPVDRIKLWTDLLSLGIISTWLIVFYRSKRSYHAYIDKVMLLFLLFYALETLHVAGHFSIGESHFFLGFFNVGQYFTVMSLLLMVYAFDRLYRFMHTSTGKYYEHTIETHPERVTRWRDELDTYILRTFFLRNTILYRIAQISKSPNTNSTKDP